MHETKNLHVCDLYDNIEISLKALGIESESFGNLLVPVIKWRKYIPSELRSLAAKQIGFWM